ncbi:MAG: hypothetical protein ABIS50_25650 [Luteolibacter sp.]|uniref:hypothetical protein n=1 Tax=Luteolibacter sp. TaxID=1962973 RepID=UPI00326532F7
MKSLFHLLTRSLIVGVLSLAGFTHAQSATQSVTLTAGWNAVWLEVEPVDNAGQTRAPQDVFSNPAILMAASPKPLAGLAEFFAEDPDSIGTFNQDEWQQWKRTDPSGGNDLAAISGNRPYLIQVAPGTANFTVTVTGKAVFFRPTWNPDRYNLVGFGLQGTPTFDQFFGPSGTKHAVSKIFSLNAATGNWQRVTGTAAMTSGQAYWVFCSGPSSYMGPVSVSFDSASNGKLGFGGPSDVVTVGSGVDKLELDLEEIVFSNLGTTSATPQLDLISTSGSGLALHVVRPAANSLAYERGNQVDSALGAGSSASLGETIATLKTSTLSLGALRGWNDDAPRTNLYRLNTSPTGASFWLPVTAIRSEVQQNSGVVAGVPASTVTGLWVGEVIADSVTSIVEDGSPIRKSAGTAPVRVILHSDANGQVRLLSQVTIMQTKTADPEIAPLPVLVVDPAKIPFFEGVKERNGKKVGVRLDSIAYDMPRKLDSVSQQSLINDPKFLALTNLSAALQIALAKDPSIRTTADNNLISSSTAAINAAKATIPSLLPGYLLSSSIRPSKLTEAYQLSISANGSIGMGQSVTAAFNLDPFHRSNPFRHAYHQNLPKGPDINRTMTFTFDSEQAVSDRLKGTFSETLHGLIKTDLTLTGRVEFRRVSPVATLEGAQ